jgi:hypothetical protein
VVSLVTTTPIITKANSNLSSKTTMREGLAAGLGLVLDQGPAQALEESILNKTILTQFRTKSALVSILSVEPKADQNLATGKRYQLVLRATIQEIVKERPPDKRAQTTSDLSNAISRLISSVLS